MVQAIKIYCPKCAREGRKKWIDSVGLDAKGPLYPPCKIHGNVEVYPDPQSSDKIYITVSA